MAMRLFAVLRTIVVSILFLSIWTWFVPRWVTGNGAFDNPRPLGHGFDIGYDEANIRRLFLALVDR